MSIASRRHVMLGMVLFALCLLSGCASPDAKIYTLSTQGGQPTAGRPLSILIERVSIAKYIDRPQLVRRSSDVQLNVSEFERWGEPLDSMIQRILAQDLQQILPAGSLVTTSETMSGREASTLELTVNRFDRDATDMIILQAQWRLHYRSGQSGAAAQVSVSVAPTGSETGAQVRAMSIAVKELAIRIAQRLR
jgi:uncharacterized lipoprotein YmbA